MQRTQLFALLAVFFAAVGLNAQAIIHVPSDQPSIQAAINAAGNGDTVLVAPGTYFENIDFLGRAITLQSQSGAAVTTINGQGLGPVVMIHSGESASTVLQGFTITNGSANFASQYSGGGIYISNASPSILNNVISGNYTCDSGGGIFSGSGSPLIQGNTITNNSQTGCSG